MLVVPLVFCSLVCGSMAIGDTKKLGRVGVKTILFYLVTTAIAITLAIGVGKLINPGIGLDMSNIQVAETTVSEANSVSDVILDIIPTNPISALSNGNMLQIIFFSILVGIILAMLNEKAKTVANFFSEFNEIMMKMTMIVMKVAPIGVFCLIATTFSNIGWSAFAPMLKYIFAVMLALFIQCLITYMAMLKIFAKLIVLPVMVILIALSFTVSILSKIHYLAAVLVNAIFIMCAVIALSLQQWQNFGIAVFVLAVSCMILKLWDIIEYAIGVICGHLFEILSV